jgi:hypothetical protein
VLLLVVEEIQIPHHKMVIMEVLHLLDLQLHQVVVVEQLVD